jgi:retron-type reverse transcriptase
MFDKHFIFDSYACRKGKGTHKAVKRLDNLVRKLSKNYTSDYWSLKCDIKQFFAAVDHQVLKDIIASKVKDQDIKWLIGNVIDSFSSELGFGKGIPLGNLTSQIFSNIYLNILDHFVKHTLKIKHYLRYADDFLILTKNDKQYDNFIATINEFLRNNLKLELHPKKIDKRKLSWGIDFCGYIVLPHHILPRTKTKRRILSKVRSNSDNQAVQSYLGYFSHANAYKISEDLKNKLFIGK